MEYTVYFEELGNVYRLPVNPEEISRADKVETEQYRVLSGKQINVVSGKALTEYSFEVEFPFEERSYTNKGFENADVWEERLDRWQEKGTAVRFIANNGLGTSINKEVLVTEVKALEKAGEEGDKYISLKLQEYVEPVRRYAAVSPGGTMRAAVHPAVNENKTHTVVKGDTLWSISRKYYGDGNQYNSIVQANNGQIKNPNLIYPGQVLIIPAAGSAVSKTSAPWKDYTRGGSRSNGPFTVLTSSYGVVQSNLMTWSAALGYYSAGGGGSKGWIIVDAGRKVVSI